MIPTLRETKVLSVFLYKAYFPLACRFMFRYGTKRIQPHFLVMLVYFCVDRRIREVIFFSYLLHVFYSLLIPLIYEIVILEDQLQC
jgi:hypothetical protein